MNSKENLTCLDITIRGIVQGVGFRPFIHNLAAEMGLKGFIANTSDGVVVNVEGSNLDVFIERIRKESPPLSRIMSIDISPCEYKGFSEFTIRDSKETGSFTLVSPDISICKDCIDELFDETNRRYLYPFINCTNCGPRYSITRSVPYDRVNTTMNVFEMCSSCKTEYNDTFDRRFHAQPNACPVCGPQVEFRMQNAKCKIINEKPLGAAIKLLKDGGIVAIKGLGGFHIACDATNKEAVERLRERKRRSNKPFALMSPDMETIKKFCYVSDEEALILSSHQRPIVLLKKKDGLELPDSIAPMNRYLGFMLPYTPLHYLLFYAPLKIIPPSTDRRAIEVTPPPLPAGRQGSAPPLKIRGGRGSYDFGREGGEELNLLNSNFSALVMTSGNLSEEPIVVDNEEAVSKLSGIVDAFILHNRDIFMRVDDSVVKLRSENEELRSKKSKMRSENKNAWFSSDTSQFSDSSSQFLVPTSQFSVIRRSRGYVPEPISLADEGPEVLGCGADMKNTFTITKGRYAIMSRHIGDMENYETLKFYEETLNNLKSVYRSEPEAVAYDLHPEYLSTKWAMNNKFKIQNSKFKILLGVQHHYAHIASVLAEKGIKEKVIGVAFDGNGYGEDGRLWGGEFLISDISGFKRAGHIEYIPLPGGEMAIKEPWRISLACLREAAGNEVWDYIKPLGFIEKYGKEKIENILKISENVKFSPLSSGAGRLFDAVAALIGICDKNTFEGEAAIALESFTVDDLNEDYPVDIIFKDPIKVDFSHTILRIVEDIVKGLDKSIIATRFHNTVAYAIIMVVGKISLISNIKNIVLSGGVFQNSYLVEKVINSMRAEGLSVYINELVPCNDAGISLGQAYIIRERIKAGII
jgi:hydrogenase maturation protein HypF